MIAADPTRPRGAAYKKLTCSICGRYGHLDRDHRATTGSNDRPQTSKGNKKSFRGKTKGKKGKVNNTNGRTVVSQDDGDNGWIGSVYAIIGTQERCSHYAFDGKTILEDYCLDSSSSESEKSDSATRLKHMNNNSYSKDENMPRVFSSDTSLQRYLDSCGESSDYSYDESYECSSESSDIDPNNDVHGYEA